MKEETRTISIKNLFILSIVVNILLASFAGYTLWQNSSLRSNLDYLSSSYNHISEISRNLEQQLNITIAQLDYYKELAEHNSNITVSASTATGIIGRATIPIVALQTIQIEFQTEYRGVVMRADIELVEGQGRILVNTVPIIGIDIQTSVRTAAMVAENLRGASLSDTDIILTITASQDVDVVDGPSAGAAITVALLAALANQGLNQDVYMTGTIINDMSIGEVGGIPYKALAAAENGSKCFIVPKGQSTIVVYEPRIVENLRGQRFITYEKKTMQLQDYLEEQGYSIVIKEVETIEEAYAIFSA